jgi:hypothetical protein
MPLADTSDAARRAATHPTAMRGIIAESRIANSTNTRYTEFVNNSKRLRCGD